MWLVTIEYIICTMSSWCVSVMYDLAPRYQSSALPWADISVLGTYVADMHREATVYILHIGQLTGLCQVQTNETNQDV
jgi:hypothetical protein